MSSNPSWQIDGEIVETVTDFIFLGSKSLQMVTAATKLKDTPWKKAMTNLDSILKRDITLPTKVHINIAMVFPVVIYGYKSWAIKKAEH